MSNYHYPKRETETWEAFKARRAEAWRALADSGYAEILLDSIEGTLRGFVGDALSPDPEKAKDGNIRWRAGKRILDDIENALNKPAPAPTDEFLARQDAVRRMDVASRTPHPMRR